MRSSSEPGARVRKRSHCQRPRRIKTSAIASPRGGVIATSRGLAARLADAARGIRCKVNAALSVETEHGKLRRWTKAFRAALFHDLGDGDFADMYAQTIVCGLLCARVGRPSALAADDVARMTPVTSPFLRELMGAFLNVGDRKRTGNGESLDFGELGINDVVEILRATKIEAVLRDFDSRNPQEDPVIHFYELFLREYDAKQRMQRGVFYTPKPVVSCIVRTIHGLLQTEFGLADGLASTANWREMARKRPGLSVPAGVDPEQPFVQILDPAAGTGTFLVEVIDVIHRAMLQKWRGVGCKDAEIVDLWNDYVPEHLLPRLYGFELLMAPYAVAHMKLGLKLAETGYRFQSRERTRVYLANSLEPPRGVSGDFEETAPALAHEVRAANWVKSEVATTVVLGNPPYSGISSNMNPWIDGLLKGHLPDGRRAAGYYEVDGEPLGEKKLWLQDDYVKFIRYGQYRIERCRVGILGYISNHGYLDNPTFRGMRQSLMETFQRISVVDLHGSTRRRDTSSSQDDDQNVFDIGQGVAIGIFRATGNEREAELRHAELRGNRDLKYRTLGAESVETISRSPLSPRSPFYFFVPRDETHRDEYEAGWALTDVMPVNVTGVVTARDHFVVDLDCDALLKRLARFRDLQLTNEAIRKECFAGKGAAKYPDGDSRGWKLPKARRKVRDDRDWRARVAPCLYRPFDVRPMYYVPWMVDWPRPEVMRHMFAGPNLGLVTTRQQSNRGAAWNLIGVTDRIVEACAISNKTREINYLFPLYVYPPEGRFQTKGREANLDGNFTDRLAEATGLSWIEEGRGDLLTSFGPDDVFHFIYAQLHSTEYRNRYCELLKADFPRVFLPRGVDLFSTVCRLGADLVAIHLLDDRRDAASWNVRGGGGESPLQRPRQRLVGAGSAQVERGFPKFRASRVAINRRRGFEPVSDSVWEFHVGAYRVAEKWLKDRRGRVLGKQDQRHYQRILIAIEETLRLTREIDHLVDQHAGWSGAFLTEPMPE